MTKVSPKCVSLSDRGVSPVSRDRAFVWLLEFCLARVHYVTVLSTVMPCACAVNVHCTCVVPSTAGQLQSSDVTCNTSVEVKSEELFTLSQLTH